MASECAPDDYLLKPFTAAQFNARLEKLLEKQEYFLGIDKATDAKNWKRVIEECDKRLAVKDKFFLDLSKIKGSALLRDGRPSEAADLYRQILALRPIGWARLGLARALVKLDKGAEAQILLREVLVDSPQFMAAYDFLGKLLVSSGDKNEALEVLQKARAVSPGTMSRLREMSTIAVSAGKPEVAEAVMRQALQQHKFSPVRQANDYAVLSKALLNQGKTAEALNVVSDARNSFKDEHSNIVLSATESVAHRAAGNHEKAEAALNKAMASTDLGKLPMHAVVALADACFVMGKETEAKGLLRHAIQNSHEDESIKGRVHDVLAAAGKGASEAAAIIEESEQEVILINNTGVMKAEAGQLDDAIALLCEAAERLPNNMQIVGNASLVMALDLVRNGNKPDRLARCLRYREMLVKKFPNNPKLPQIDGLLKQLKQ
jgi:tetratricopeptide (TPR) repeat protein